MQREEGERGGRDIDRRKERREGSAERGGRERREGQRQEERKKRGQWRERREREEGGTKTGGKKEERAVQREEGGTKTGGKKEERSALDNHTKREKFSEENSEVPVDITPTDTKEMLLVSLTHLGQIEN